MLDEALSGEQPDAVACDDVDVHVAPLSKRTQTEQSKDQIA